ncbi:MAG TPA: hypothetical protein VE732_01280 [Nitrososphaera sp.]|nr:hypothetical protein [Nitrososphaera sp.]
MQAEGVSNQLSKEKQQNEELWIRVEDESPEEDTTVLVYTSDGDYAFGRFAQGQWDIDGPPWQPGGGNNEEISYWRYLPLAPIENVNIRTTGSNLNFRI